MNDNSRTWTGRVPEYLIRPHHSTCFLFHLFQLQKTLILRKKLVWGSQSNPIIQGDSGGKINAVVDCERKKTYQDVSTSEW